MKIKIISSAVVAALALVVSTAVARPYESKSEVKKGETVAKVAVKPEAGQPCAHKCIPPCDPANCDHRCDPAKCGKLAVPDKAKGGCNKPCCAKSAKTVALEPKDDGPGGPPLQRWGTRIPGRVASPTAKAVGHPRVSNLSLTHSEAGTKIKKGGCSKPCGGKSSKTVADKGLAGDSPRHGHTVADKAEPPCHAKHATTTADKTGKCGCKKGCGGKCGCRKGAKLTANKSDDGSVIRCPLTGEPIKEEDCPILKAVNAVLASMPAMKYRVSEETTGCSKSAAAMAEKTGKPIEYLVGEEVVSDRGRAMVKLAALLEKEAQTLRTMRFVAGGKCHLCPVTAKSVAKKTNTKVAYRVGGVDFENKEGAEKALKSINEALADVKMEYKVDGATYGCSMTAGAKSKETGKKLTYLIGDEETCCDRTANLMLTEAKIRKIVEAAITTSLSL